MNIPRILIGAGASGSGKTLITCGILAALQERGLNVASFKCGPDYIDPMFHSQVLGTRSRNLDTFFTGEKVTRALLEQNARDADIAVMEGVMGFYDGVGGTTTQASAYELSRMTRTPAVLVLDCRGMSVSIAAYMKGFLEYRGDNQIQGVILNQLSPMLYQRMKGLLEKELHLEVLGYVPKVDDCVIDSRHLGLVKPEEIPDLLERLKRLANILEKTMDIDALIEMAKGAPALEAVDLKQEDPCFSWHLPEPLPVAVARDDAFCFFYEDNFRLLEEMGAKIIYFSPLKDREVPREARGLMLYGGYPELHAKILSRNRSMRKSIYKRITEGMPCVAECGGFMYLHESMEDMDGNAHKMVGVIPGGAYKTPKLNHRFGYVHLSHGVEGVFGQEVGEIPAHEFHYFDSPNCGTDYLAKKPASTRSWECMHSNGQLFAGFPHFHYYGNPQVAKAFLEKCLQYSHRKGKR
ncbi:MAG: cobyrinate a,c-diamide synthase [Lachnospiraceae bacterium]|nr:cobyrinate a,c-diamide synthase [Lachnospiraceae bacterium]